MFRSCSLSKAVGWLSPACWLVVALIAGLANGSEPARGMMGVTLRDEAGRVLVKDVYVDGPAFVAGIRPGDRIIAVGHKAVNTSAELLEVMADYGPNDRVELYASRDGWMKDLPITLGSREDVARLRLLVNSPETPQARTRSVPVRPSKPLVHPDPFHRKRYERW